MNWERINHEFDRIDRATYGFAEFLVVGGTCSLIYIGLYSALYATLYGYLQLYTLATGAF
jgi:hypothetical protein